MRVRLSDEARAYLIRERAYLHARSIPAAAAFIARMRKARENLGRFQEIGFGPGRLPIPGARRLIVGDYIKGGAPPGSVSFEAMSHRMGPLSSLFRTSPSGPDTGRSVT